MAEDMNLMAQLSDFANQEVPLLLWKGKGRFANLFKFLAARFLANPDSVLDVERQHAVWQWVLQRRRSMKLKTLNAWLKLGQYLRSHAHLPPSEILAPYIASIRQGERIALAGLRGESTVAAGQHADAIYWERLNLSVADSVLLAADAREIAGPPRSYEVEWGIYLRWTFVKNRFYSFEGLRSELYLYVAENKSLPGRESRAEGEALGRPLAVAWFEKREINPDGSITVQRVDRTSATALKTMLSTVAEIYHAAGAAYKDFGEDGTSRIIEIDMEERMGTEPRLIWIAEHLWEEEDPWVFRLSGSEPAELKYLEDESSVDPGKLTNMALARLLELLTGEDRRLSSRRRKRDLLEAIAAA